MFFFLQRIYSFLWFTWNENRHRWATVVRYGVLSNDYMMCSLSNLRQNKQSKAVLKSGTSAEVLVLEDK